MDYCVCLSCVILDGGPAIQMADNKHDWTFLKELTRRKVFRSAAAYMVVAWVLVQVASIVFPEFGAPDWSMRALIIVLIAGFPPAMLLAWTIDLSPQGISRTAESGYTRARGHWPRLAVLIAATALSGGALWLTWTDYIVQPDRKTSRPAIRDQAVVAVNSPTKLAGRADTDWLGDGIANLIRGDLAESRHVIVMSQSRWHMLVGNAESQQDVAMRAKEVGVDYLIDGEYLETPGGIVLTLHVEDLKNGIEIQSLQTSKKDEAGIIASIPELGVGIKQALRVPYRESVGLYEADFAVGHVAAYEAYIAGLAYYINFDFQAAEDSLKAALAIAPDYHIARFRLAQVYNAIGRSELAYQTLEQIPLDAQLSERERLYLEGAKHYFIARQAPKKAIEVYRKLVDLYPYETEAGQLLAEAYWLDFQDDAAIAEFRRLSELHPYDPVSWMSLGERLLDVGELDEAKSALDRYARMVPQDSYAFTLLGNLNLLQGNLAQAIGNYERALELKPGFAVARLGLARGRYLAGDFALAVERWRSLIDDTDAVAGFRIDAAFDLAGVLQGRGMFADSMEPINQVMSLIREEELRTALALSTLGLAQLELGNIERASVYIDEAIQASPGIATRYLFARGLLELREGYDERLQSTIAEIEALAESDADLTEIKAARYLAGMSALERGDLDAAVDLLDAAVELDGYEYAAYKKGLSLLHRARGDLDTAYKLAVQVRTERDRGDLRLDLELDRARALLLQAEILAEQGSVEEARQHAREFIDLWRNAAADSDDLTRAQTLLNTRVSRGTPASIG